MKGENREEYCSGLHCAFLSSIGDKSDVFYLCEFTINH